MYDFTIVGGGIVGLSTAMALSQKHPQAKLAVLEKESTWGFHQSGRNSGVIHSGIYYKPGSLKAKLCREGNQALVKFCQEHNIKHNICGKIIVATREEELQNLENLYQRGLQNGLHVSKLDQQQVQEIEPNVRCIAGIKVPSTGLVDYQEVCQSFAEIVQDRGGELYTNSCVQKIEKTQNGYYLEVSNGRTIDTKKLINCTGLYSDRVTKLAGLNPDVKIIPFRGEYYELKPEKRYLVNNLIYPVPNPDFPFLGVHFTRTIDDRVHAGPNAVLSLKREGYQKTDFNWNDFVESITYPGLWKLASQYLDEGLKEMGRSLNKAAFVRSLQQLIPEIQADDLVPAPAGVRAQALKSNGQLVDDFLIVQEGNSIHICNAPSPAATASIEIGKAIVSKLEETTN
jgi:L-2-hydroxyglutarate oxidase